LGSSDEKTATVTIRDAAVDISVDASDKDIDPSGTGSTPITITATVINSEGLPLASAPVIFETEAGTFDDSGIEFTNSSGQATKTLSLTQSQIGSRTSITVKVTTPRANGEPPPLEDEVVIVITR
jgi:Bacterial Ig-like domain (group 1)